MILGFKNKTDPTWPGTSVPDDILKGEKRVERDRAWRKSRSYSRGKRESEPSREMRFRGAGAQREGERHRKDSCRNNICSCLHVSAPLVRGIWEKCIFIAYKNFMNTKECHRRSRRTRHSDRETDVGDHRERWRLPWRCLRQLAAHWDAVEPMSERWCTATPTGTCHLMSGPVRFTVAWHNRKVQNIKCS